MAVRPLRALQSCQPEPLALLPVMPQAMAQPPSPPAAERSLMCLCCRVLRVWPPHRLPARLQPAPKLPPVPLRQHAAELRGRTGQPVRRRHLSPEL